MRLCFRLVMPKQNKKKWDKPNALRVEPEIMELAREHAKRTGMTIKNVFAFAVRSYVKEQPRP